MAPAVDASGAEPLSARRGEYGRVNARGRRDGPTDALMVLYALALFLLPSDVVVGALGAAGSPAALIGLLLLVISLYRLVGNSSILVARLPGPLLAVVALVGASCLAYIGAPRSVHNVLELNSADRWMLTVGSCLGLVLSISQSRDIGRTMLLVLRLVAVGGAYEGIVSALQWTNNVDLAALAREYVPLLSVNGQVTAFAVRGSLARVTGTGLSPIELGTVAGMCLPVSLGLALLSSRKTAWLYATSAALTLLALPASVARSGVIAVGVGVVVLLVFIPMRSRIALLVPVPFLILLLFAVRPGYIETVLDFFAAGSQDSSIDTRLQDYGPVYASFLGHPLVGTGGGTYLPTNAIDILDNQYLKSLLELGAIGALSVIGWFVGSLLSGVALANRVGAGRDRVLIGGLVGGLGAAAISAATFDAFSFPLYLGVDTMLLAGLTGAWLMQERRRVSGGFEY